MIADVADALDHAHTHGVLHRDVKPANLLLAADGRLSVNDFGLARVLEEPGMTMTGEFVGTPAYMSPEQVTAGRVPIDPRTDSYSLGATLYELLTLRPPFTADRRDQLLGMVVQKEPTPPGKVIPKVPRDLETVCLKCLEKDPDRCYRSAQDLADDLRRYVNRFAIRARRAGPLTRLKKWARRNPALAAACGAMPTAVAAAGFFAYRSHLAERRAEADRRQHQEELRDERRQTREIAHELYGWRNEEEERRWAALQRGVVAAMSGDFAGADRALDDVFTDGASVAEVQFLRDQIALRRGNRGEAIGGLLGGVGVRPAVGP